MSHDQPPALAFRGVSAGYNGHLALEGVSFTLPAATLTGLVGPNGSGKSTLFKAALGLLPLRHGDVRLFGRPPQTVRRRVGYMPQSELVDWDFPVTVGEVVMMARFAALGPIRWPGRRDRAVVAQALERVGMSDLTGRLIGELSGGQQRRVLMARTLAQEADLLLLDEPMAGLDATSQHDLLSLFESLRDEGRTLLVSTHDLSCVAGCFDYALLLNRQLIAFGPPAEVFTRDLLNQAFRSHLLLVPSEGPIFAAGHHEHSHE